ncbi:uncharacterized protein B0T23DRAFT_426286 [Neurospora hispaniola]|uniref:RING-type domain-containing protein n=1 Tax=Neurospora hispaniola TaxID=588809 RepID=A0AAJ0MTN1_9PEZI|nr:hypothetical protein B0T23DRAFT_426286 [Neurospora hispaniola]
MDRYGTSFSPEIASSPVLDDTALLLSNPAWRGGTTISNTVIRNVTALTHTLTVSTRIAENITVLASKYAATQNGVIQGLLYVPDLSERYPCVDNLTAYIPESAPRRAQLPPANINLIALVPWINAQCARHFLISARQDPVRGLIFYKPDNSTEKPPKGSSDEWDIGDGGKWRSQAGYPIYAMSGAAGQRVMNQLSLYSGNVSEIPFGDRIAQVYNPSPGDFVRVWTELSVSTDTALPGIWVYILIIIGVLLGAIIGISLLMHFIQAKRRSSLRRRVISGEVNLERMGIKRLRVPMEVIDTFPLFTYHYEPDSISVPTSPRSLRPDRPRGGSRTQSEAATAQSVSGLTVAMSEKAPSTVATDYQPACAICLEPYQNRVTVIREIPCGHIFHTQCIDEFLSENSSLCPICKACMLPSGYCPKITNAMVRRERAVRRLRDRITVEDSCSEYEMVDQGKPIRGGKSLRSLLGGGGDDSKAADAATIATTPSRMSIRQGSIQRAGRKQQKQVGSNNNGNVQRGSPPVLGRKRMRELAGGSDIDDGESRAPAWERLRRKVFPGF